MTKPKKMTLYSIISIIIIVIVFLVGSCVKCSPTFVFRILTHFDSSVMDYSFFPSRQISKGDKAYIYTYDIDKSLPDLEIKYITSHGNNETKSLEDFVVSMDSSSFIIVKDDKIVYEQYANGYDRESVNTTFSAAKSIDSLLIGKAIEDGYINNENQSIASYISEFTGTNMEQVTIKDLLTMRSDISYEESGILWFRDDAYTYWMPDLRKLALEHRTLTDQYNGKFHYNNYHPLLLGIILERSTGMSVSEYFEKSIWEKIGSEYNASWSLDSASSQFEKMESGINFRSIDFIKIGSMVLHGGYWNNQQIISKSWIENSIAQFPVNESEYEDSFLEGRNIGYGYMWYSKPSSAGGLDIIAWGKYNQILYISPKNNVVILRTGLKSGDVNDFSDVLDYIATHVGQMGAINS